MHRYRQLVGIFIIFVFFASLGLLPDFASGSTLQGSMKSGPYVDKLVYKVITQDDQQILSLLDDEIDIIGDMVDPSFIPELEEADNVAVDLFLRNGYGYLTINCAKYPLNTTDFRRALAFAMDKEAVSEDAWDGLAEPIDSLIPKCNPFSIEGQLPYTYYRAEYDIANQLLDEAGFRDVDEDGWREAPDGSDFDVIVEVAQCSCVAAEVGYIAAECWRNIGIDAECIPTDFNEYLNRLYFHGNYDVVFLGSSFSSSDVDWIAYEYWSEYADESYYNFPSWRNQEYDSWRDQLLYSVDYFEVYEAAIEMQRIWVYECPMIICYENVLLTAYRTDRFEGIVTTTDEGAESFWTRQKAHLKISEGGPYGGTLRFSSSLDMDLFNFMVSCSCYCGLRRKMPYDSLIRQDSDGFDIPWLAESYYLETHEDNSIVPEGHTRITFNILQNASWTDGESITAEDCAYTLNFYRDAPGNPFGIDLSEMTAAYAQTNHTLIVEFQTESYWHLHTIGYKPIIPKHVFVEIGIENWNRWNPDPFEEGMVTSGAFYFSDYEPGEFLEMSANQDYFYRPDNSSETLSTSNNTYTGTSIFDLNLPGLALTSGSLFVIIGVVILWKNDA